MPVYKAGSAVFHLAWGEKIDALFRACAYDGRIQQSTDDAVLLRLDGPIAGAPEGRFVFGEAATQGCSRFNRIGIGWLLDLAVGSGSRGLC